MHPIEMAVSIVSFCKPNSTRGARIRLSCGNSGGKTLILVIIIIIIIKLPTVHHHQGGFFVRVLEVVQSCCYGSAQLSSTVTSRVTWVRGEGAIFKSHHPLSLMIVESPSALSQK